MRATVWAKFFWADWLSDVALRRCSPAARGLWMDLLCVAAQSAPVGTIALDMTGIARVAGVSVAEAEALAGELETAGVFSRDRKGRIYSRRMVRDAKLMRMARQSGQKGGRLTRDKQKGIFGPLKGPPKGRCKGGLAPRSQSPETRSQESSSQEASSQGAAMPAAGRLIAEAAAALGVGEASLRRRIPWISFGDMIAGLMADGCDLERDVWPTMRRIGARLVDPPASPQYFRAAILDARDRRLSGGTEGPEPGSGVSVSAGEWRDRLAVFAAEGAWSSRWGPKPGEAGCRAPARTADDGMRGAG